jgi:hypothetical protein
MSLSTTRIPLDPNRRNVIAGVSSTPGDDNIYPAEVDPATGRLLVTSTAGGSLITVSYDAIAYTDTSSTVDTYTFYLGGLSGVLVATVTITYTDSTKAVVSTVVRT